MSIFDDNILDRVPEEMIWNWLENTQNISFYIQDEEVKIKYLN